jgi:UDP-N-acetylglucosamine diphosphorylase/glucosamine-1-phosphate N-acetyltransferase
MRNLIFFDDDNWNSLLPLTYTRPISELRVGILTLREKWQKYFNFPVSYIAQDYLSIKYPVQIGEENLIINSSYLPIPDLVALVRKLSINQVLLNRDEFVAAVVDKYEFKRLSEEGVTPNIQGIEISLSGLEFTRITRPYDLLSVNGVEISRDIKRMASIPSDVPAGVVHFGDHPLIIEKGAKLRPCTINTEEGPVYIGINAEVMEGSMIRGPFALCEGSSVKMGAKIYGDSTVGPFSKVGGELNNVIIQGNSNKAHDGFLGNSILGEWCNIGADSNNSNLKNNYEEVKLWNYSTNSFQKTGRQFCGLFMGDHSKCGINTMFNTGTAVGVSTNIFGSGFPRNFVPSFAWGGASGFSTFLIDKALDTAQKVMQRRNRELDEVDKDILRSIYSKSASYRQWEK